MGEILGSMIAAYLVCKLLELILLRWIIKNHTAMVLISAPLVGVLFVLAFHNKARLIGADYDDQTLLGSQIIAVVLIPVVRIIWHRLRGSKKEGEPKAK